MPRPRADFSCETCEEGYTLPVESDNSACLTPGCDGILKRLWNQAPGVISDTTKVVDSVVGPEYLRQRANRPAVPANQQSQRLSGQAALGMLGGEAKLWSQISGAGTINLLNKTGGPVPIWAKKPN